ncbi:MAG: hypothetical protein JNJ88_02535 [Planctomycetes bacterium]|nr:hypothetical protein [Planctomycetota bacterium]
MRHGYFIAFAALSGCQAAPRLALLVPSSDVERRLAVDACPRVVARLGSAHARALLEGHLVRPGSRATLVLREWDGRSPESVRRLTLAFDPEREGVLRLPSAEIDLQVDRVTLDGMQVTPLSIAQGRLEIRSLAAAEIDLRLELQFGEPAEPPIRFDRAPNRRALESLSPLEGRAQPHAEPARFVQRSSSSAGGP